MKTAMPEICILNWIHGSLETGEEKIIEIKDNTKNSQKLNTQRKTTTAKI